MYTTNFYPPTFYHNYASQFYPAAIDAQPRVGNPAGKRSLLPGSGYSYSFYLTGIILGSLILLLSLALLSIEITRVYRVSTAHGSINLKGTSEYLNNENISIAENVLVQMAKSKNNWLWPWSTPAMIFSIVFIATAIMGIVSGLRENYPTILAFFICSLLCIFLLIFVIASYSITIAAWNSTYGIILRNLMQTYANFDRNMAIAGLSLSCVLFPLLLASIILSGLAIDLCRRKDFTQEDA